jgi:hypothetical protein
MTLVMDTDVLPDDVVSFEAGDGLDCNMIRIRRPDADKGPVLMVPGSGVRANLFRPPVHTTLVDYLVAAGYDVFLENWRASMDLDDQRWTLDEAALYDHPRAVEKIVEVTKQDEVQAIVHCQGSTSFVMSVAAGLVPQVKTVITNSVSFHPIVPRISRLKIMTLTPMMSAMRIPRVNAHWGEHPLNFVGKSMRLFVRATHRECDNTTCRMVSFIFGAGRPALWSHANLNPQTHFWIKQEFGNVPMSFFQQMRRSVAAGHLVAASGLPGMPTDFGVDPPKTDARFVFFTGLDNKCFHPRAQEKSYEYVQKHVPGDHALHKLEGYGHLDVFMGRNSARDVFPTMVGELD